MCSIWKTSSINTAKGKNNIKLILLIQLHMSRFYRSFRLDYLNNIPRPIPNKASQSSTAKSQYDLGTRLESGLNTNGNIENEQLNETHWLEYRWMDTIFGWYYRISTIYMIYVVAKNLLPVNLVLKMLHLNKPANCYLVGRLGMTKNVSKTAATTFSLLHLIWRMWTSMIGPKRIDLYLFLLENEIDIQRQYKLQSINYNSSENYQLEALDLKLKSTMCYKQRFRNQIIYKLRPNRTLLSRNELCDYVQRVFLIGLLAFFLIFWPFFIEVTNEVLFDVGYLEAYRGCHPELERLFSEHKIDSWSINIGQHRLIALIADISENVIIWFDCGLALTMIAPIVYILCFDMSLYWQSTEAQIKVLRDLSKNLSVANDISGNYCHQNFNDQSKMEHKHKIRIESNEIHAIELDITQNLTIDSNEAINVPWQQILTEHLLEHIICEIHDFFKQIKRADCIVSDITTIEMVIWCAIYAVLSFFLNEIHLDSIPARVTQMFDFVIICALSFAVFRLQHQVKKSYGLICSILATNRSLKRSRLHRILDFYGPKEQVTFTILRKTPFVATTFMTIVAWSFSCVVILQNLLKDRIATEGNPQLDDI